MDLKLQMVIIMLMMLALSFFIYVLMIPAHFSRVESSEVIHQSVVESDIDVVQESDTAGVIWLLLFIPIIVVSTIFVYRKSNRRKKVDLRKLSSDTEIEKTKKD